MSFDLLTKTILRNEDETHCSPERLPVQIAFIIWLTTYTSALEVPSSFHVLLIKLHLYCGFIKGAMASHITSLTIVYSTVCSGGSKKTSKLPVTGLCAGNSLVTGEFPAQMVSNAENASSWWLHHVSLWVCCHPVFYSTGHLCFSQSTCA